MSENQDDLGSDVAEDVSRGDAENKGKREQEAKPNKSKKGTAPAPTPSRNGSAAAPSEPPTDTEGPTRDNDTPRAKALQARALERATEVKRRVGQTIKCPHCESLLYVEKTHPEKGLRDLVCKNPECSRLDIRSTPYRKTVSLSRPIENEEEDHGVMSERQRAHLVTPAE